MTDYPICRDCPECDHPWLQHGPRGNAPRDDAAPMICDSCRGRKSAYTRRAVGSSQAMHPVMSSVGNQWRLHALCFTVVDADRLFFPENHGSMKAIREAKALCAACPVRQECLTYALETQQQDGIWGGLTLRERRGLAKGRAS